MRIIDVACGTSFAAGSIILLLALNPGPVSRQVSDLGRAGAAQSLIMSYLELHGLQFLASSDYGTICASAGSFGNQSARISVIVDGKRCPELGLPPGGAPDATSTVILSTRTVTLEAWNLEER